MFTFSDSEVPLVFAYICYYLNMCTSTVSGHEVHTSTLAIQICPNFCNEISKIYNNFEMFNYLCAPKVNPTPRMIKIKTFSEYYM